MQASDKLSTAKPKGNRSVTRRRSFGLSLNSIANQREAHQLLDNFIGSSSKALIKDDYE
jgi:hypothetical protein